MEAGLLLILIVVIVLVGGGMLLFGTMARLRRKELDPEENKLEAERLDREGRTDAPPEHTHVSPSQRSRFVARR